MAARSMIFLCLAIAIAAAAVGCGGSDEDSSAASDSPLTKTEFIKQAEEVCNQARGNLSGAFTAYLKKHENSSLSKEEVFADMMQTVLLPTIEKGIEGLEELEPPPADKARIEAFLVAQQKGVDSMRNLKRLSEGPDGEKYLEPASTLARAYGIRACAQS